MYDRYQSSQQHPEAQHVMSYHNMGHYPEGPRYEPVMTELSVHRDPPLYQEPFYQNYPLAVGHSQEPVYQQSIREQQLPPVLPPPQPQHTIQQQEPSVHHQPPPAGPPQVVMPVKKKRGRPPKNQTEGGEVHEEDNETENAKKAKRALNRFNGMSVAEVMTKTLPDIITYHLDILIIGINPGLLSAFKGHHYPNPGNHFWKCLFLSGLTDQQLSYMHDHSLPEKYSIGFTNMVERTTPGSKDLSNKEIRQGGRQLLEKLQKYKPLIAAFNGKGIYEIFCKEIFGVKAKNLEFGLQPYKIPETETVCYLMPSSSPRCAQFPRAQDKVHFYIKLKELRDQMKGVAPSGDVLEEKYSFDLQMAKEDAKRIAIKEEQVDPEYESCIGLHEDVRQSCNSSNKCILKTGQRTAWHVTTGDTTEEEESEGKHQYSSQTTQKMEEKLNGSLPVGSSEYLQQWVRSAQQFQALQAQYSALNPNHYPDYPETHTGATAMAHMANPVPMDQQEPTNLAKPPAKKRGRAAQPKEPKPPKVPKEPKPPKVPKAPKPPKDPNAPKAKPGPKPKKGAEGQADGKQEKIDESFKKVKRKVDRFKGMSEEEVMKKTLPDLLDYNLDYVIIGINPGLMAAFIGRWFPGPGNHFWKCLFLSGFTEEQLNHMHDTTLPVKYKMGFTNMVARATPGSKDLSSKELREGGKILVEKLKKYKPLIAVFNGKCIYEMFCRELFGKKPQKLEFGLQPHKIPDCDVALYLMPSSSARCAQFPRAQDKVHFYIKLRELRDQLQGVQRSSEIEEVNYTFDLHLAKEDAKRLAIKEEQYDPGYEDAYGGAYTERGPEGSQANGHCTFSSAENTESAPEATTSQTAEGQLPDGQWMTQSFADQIPDISGSKNPSV
ncbi:uncharacterized protein ACBR49_003370 [Aulostomus maculatus]